MFALSQDSLPSILESRPSQEDGLAPVPGDGSFPTDNELPSDEDSDLPNSTDRWRPIFNWDDQCCSQFCFSKLQPYKHQLDALWECRCCFETADEVTYFVFNLMREARQCGVNYQLFGIETCIRSFRTLLGVGARKLSRCVTALKKKGHIAPL